MGKGMERLGQAAKEPSQQERGAVGKAVDAVMATNFMNGKKGMATLAGYARGGLKDLQDVVLNAFPDSQKPREELGMIATPTPQMITEGLTGKKMNLGQDRIAAPEPEKQPAAQKTPQKAPEPEIELER